jgi:uncharacterized membrane protein
MSMRVYNGPHSDRGSNRPSWANYVPWVFTALTILGQILWILVSGDTRIFFTAMTVTTFFLASLSHAYLRRGLGWTCSFFSISFTFGWLIEVLGTTTQFPFGDYDYSDKLGLAVLGVPILIPMAWSMMAYPVMLATQRMAATPLATAFIGGWLLAAWDLFLDPMMVGEAYWTWNELGWVLPGIPDIPLQNFLGWLLSAIALAFALNLLPRKIANDTVPNTLLIWIYFSNILAAAVFFGAIGVALWGGIAMGLFMFPWMWRIWSQPQW